jgi:hypothetical protein
MAGPAIVIVAGFITAWLAIKSYDGLVEDNYYKVGLAVNQQLQQKHLAAQLGLKADLTYVEGHRDVQLVLAGLQPAALPDDIRLKLVHPTRKGEDQIVILHRAGNQFSGKFQDSPSVGRWKVILEDPVAGWRMDTVWDLRTDPHVTFAAKSN